MGLGDYKETSSDTRARTEQKTIRKVLKIIASKKASYLSEIEQATMLKQDEIKRALYELKQNDVIESLTPKVKHSDNRLMSRKDDMYANGVKGLDSWRQINWYGLNSDLNWVLSVAGRKKFVDEYGHEIPRDQAHEMLDKSKQPEQYASDLIEG